MMVIIIVLCLMAFVECSYVVLCPFGVIRCALFDYVITLKYHEIYVHSH